MHSLVFLSKAREDLRYISKYTTAIHGDAQCERYERGFETAFESIIQNPMIGSSQEWFGQDMRRFVHQSHSIYYKLEENEILIVRVLGPGQDPRHEFS